MNLLVITLPYHWDSGAMVVHKNVMSQAQSLSLPSCQYRGWQEDHCVWECSPKLAGGMSQGEERRQRLALWTSRLPWLLGAPFSMPWWHMGVFPALRVVLKAEGIWFVPCIFFSFFCSVVAVLIYSLYKKQPELCWTLNNKCSYLKHWQLFRYKFIFKLRLVSSGYLDETPDIFCGHGVFFRVSKVLSMGQCSVTFFLNTI